MTERRDPGLLERLRPLTVPAGPLVAIAVFLLLPPASEGGLSDAGRATSAVGTWMALWWLTEAIPIAATALLPLAVFPLTGARTANEAASPYANPLIFLFLGGFVLALAMERWGLHRRIALATLALVGTRPRAIVGGFMGVTAFLSLWTSNTATAVMMLPIALSVIGLVARAEDAPDAHPRDQAHFALALLLGIAYAASIGGVGTIVGTAPNLFLVSFVRAELGREISFARWLLVGLPLVVVFVPLTWLLLTRVLYPIRMRALPGGRELLTNARAELGPMNAGEKKTAVVFLLTAAAWLFRPLMEDLTLFGRTPFAGLTDPGIAILAALLLFALPAQGEPVMDWKTAKHLPWDILLLFGGGLSLADALAGTGVAEHIGQSVTVLAGIPSVLVIAAVTAFVVFLTEVTSNTATTAALVPIFASVAPGLGLDPLALAVPAAIAASCAFMLPVATPPNAIVFASGHVQIGDMARAGFWLNLVSVAIVTAVTYLLVLPILAGG